VRLSGENRGVEGGLIGLGTAAGAPWRVRGRIEAHLVAAGGSGAAPHLRPHSGELPDHVPDGPRQRGGLRQGLSRPGVDDLLGVGGVGWGLGGQGEVRWRARVSLGAGLRLGAAELRGASPCSRTGAFLLCKRIHQRTRPATPRVGTPKAGGTAASLSPQQGARLHHVHVHCGHLAVGQDQGAHVPLVLGGWVGGG
jgi:hypothetical protein